MNSQTEGDLLAIAILLGRDISRPLSTHAIPYEVSWEEVCQKFGVTEKRRMNGDEVKNALALWGRLFELRMRPVVGVNNVLMYQPSADAFINYALMVSH